MQKLRMLIDGKFAEVASGKWFDSYKDSGLGRENGIDAVREYLQQKSVWINTGAVTDNPFVMR